MTVQQYLHQRLTKSALYQLTKQDKKIIANQGIENYIFKKLTTKKFRKWSLTDEVKTMIKNIIKQKVSKNKPLIFTFPFGGYKLWRLPSFPDIDWAEFFTIAHTLSYLAPIAAAYKPGFELIFTSDEIIIERMNNIAQEKTDIGLNSYKKLIAVFTKFLPNNAQLKFIPIRNLYRNEQEVFEHELAALVKTEQELWHNESKEKQTHRFAMSKLNIKMNGKEPWHKLSKQQQKQKIIQGAILHHAYIQVSRRLDLVKGPGKIIVFSFPIPGIPCIAIGSTKASANKFWTGMGVLEKTTKKFKEIILSPQQLEKAKNKKHHLEKIDLLPLNNFKNIIIYEEALNFS